MAEAEPHTDDSPDTDDDGAFAAYSAQLAELIEASLAPWVERSVRIRIEATGGVVGDDVADAAAAAGERCRAEVAPQVRALLSTDLDDQRATPLALLRSATSYATEVLRDAGVAPTPRDEFEQRAFPADVYALSPASFGDIDDSLTEPGLIWGAAKAHTHMARRRRAGGAS